MNVGTKSLLLGNHQFILHPTLVAIAWCRLYGMPNLKELTCIIIHDWGLSGKYKMDDSNGELHPLLGANIAKFLFGYKYYQLCLGHSRFLCKRLHIPYSKLCMADKLGTAIMPTWLWVLLGNMTGENNEYIADTKYEIHNPNIRKISDYFNSYKDKVQYWLSNGLE